VTPLGEYLFSLVGFMCLLFGLVGMKENIDEIVVGFYGDFWGIVDDEPVNG